MDFFSILSLKKIFTDTAKLLSSQQNDLKQELENIEAVTVGVSTVEYKGNVFPSQVRKEFYV